MLTKKIKSRIAESSKQACSDMLTARLGAIRYRTPSSLAAGPRASHGGAASSSMKAATKHTGGDGAAGATERAAQHKNKDKKGKAEAGPWEADVHDDVGDCFKYVA